MLTNLSPLAQPIGSFCAKKCGRCQTGQTYCLDVVPPGSGVKGHPFRGPLWCGKGLQGVVWSCPLAWCCGRPALRAGRVESAGKCMGFSARVGGAPAGCHACWLGCTGAWTACSVCQEGCFLPCSTNSRSRHALMPFTPQAHTTATSGCGLGSATARACALAAGATRLAACAAAAPPASSGCPPVSTMQQALRVTWQAQLRVMSKLSSEHAAGSAQSEHTTSRI